MIYVLVPAHNEAPTVGLLLWKVRRVFAALGREYQLLVVNDGSTDGSDAVLAPYARALPLTLITHRERQGYARSVEELLRLAASRTDKPRRDLAVLLQADFSDSPDDIVELVRRIESGADLALADYRRRPGLPRREALARRVLPVALHGSASGSLPPRLDWVCTLKAVRLVTLARLISQRGARPLLQTDGWAADAELLLELARHARRVDVVPIATPAMQRRRPSRVRILRATWAAWAVARRPGRGAAPAAEQEAAPGTHPRRGRRRGGRRRAAAPPNPSQPVPSR